MTKPELLTLARAVFNILGLTSVCATTILGLLVFYNINTAGYFRGVETNAWIAHAELAAVIFAAFYFTLLTIKSVRALKEQKQ